VIGSIESKVMDTSPGKSQGAAVFARLVTIALLVGTSLPTALPAAAMPKMALKATGHRSDIVNVLTTCDTRGCFTFGPRQSYHRPAYRPIGPIGPGQNSQRGAAPRFLYRPQPPAALPSARLPAADPLFHRQSCMNRYRSYNPLTDSYIGSGGRTVRCRLSDRR
jgi:hypothetical protein